MERTMQQQGILLNDQAHKIAVLEKTIQRQALIITEQTTSQNLKNEEQDNIIGVSWMLKSIHMPHLWKKHNLSFDVFSYQL